MGIEDVLSVNLNHPANASNRERAHAIESDLFLLENARREATL